MRRGLAPIYTLAAGVVAAAVLTGCGGDGGRSPLANRLSHLEGTTIGLVALDGVPSLSLRYVLQEGAGIDSRALGGAVRYQEAPGDTLVELLDTGQIGAAALPPQVAFGLLNDPAYVVLASIPEDMHDITGEYVQSSVLATYGDLGQARPEALEEARALIRDSNSYFRANKDRVLDELTEAGEYDKPYVAWQSDRIVARLGDVSEGVREAIQTMWEAAVEVGDFPQAPPLGQVWMQAGQDSRGIAGRETVTIAVLDDVVHRAALFAIAEGLVSSDLVDVDVTFLSPSGLIQAVQAREYDVVEASPLLVAREHDTRLNLAVFSGAIEDRGATLLVEKS